VNAARKQADNSFSDFYLYFAEKLLCMKKHLLQLLIFVLFYNTMQSQLLRTPLSSQYTSFTALSIEHADAFAGAANQASLAHLTSGSAGVYSERRFMLKELSYYHAAVAVPTTYGGFGMAMHYQGFSDYNESQLSIGYGKQLGKKLSLGMAVNYNAIRIKTYGNTAFVNFELGTLWQLNDNICAGVHVYNPIGAKFGAAKQEKLASVYKTGLGYTIEKKFYAGFNLIKEEQQPVQVQAGIEYMFAKQFFARAGVTTGNSNFFAGTGWAWQRLRLDIVVSHQLVLGITPSLMLLYSFSSNSKE
jgi:hypothetical protein